MVGLLDFGEQCSAAGGLDVLYCFLLAYKALFDVVWLRDTVRKVNFECLAENICAQENANTHTNTRFIDEQSNKFASSITHIVNYVIRRGLGLSI